MSTSQNVNEQNSPWRYYIPALAGVFVVVGAVNALMVFDALKTFPGEAGDNAFDVSNQYNAMLDKQAREKSAGWTIEFAAQPGDAVLVRAAGRDGQTIPGAALRAEARRPVGPAETTALTFHPTADGRFASDQPLPGIGQWDVAVTVQAGDEGITTTRRVVAR